MRLASILVLIFAAAAAGQQKKKTTPTAPEPTTSGPTVFPLESLKVQGNQRISSEKIIEVSGLKIGATVIRGDFDSARDRLLATGAFESVGCAFKPSLSNQGYAGTIEVVEVEQLYPYRFEDLPVPEDQLRAAVRQQERLLGDQIPGTQEVLNRYLAAIQKVVGPDLKLTAKLTTIAESEYVILFRPDTPRSRVAEVQFSGNEVIPSAALQRAFGEVAFGTTYSEPTIRAMLDAGIRPLYDARGRIRVAFTSIQPEPAKEYDGVLVKVTINEGPSYSLGAVQFAGVSASDAAELKRVANLEPNDVANFDDVKAALERIYTRFRTKGYLRVSGRADRDVDDKAHRVNVTLAIDPGAQFHMGKLEIAGLDILSEPHIRKAWSLQPGAAFEPQYPDTFLKELRDQGVFDNLGKTRAETNVDEKSHVVDVTLYFAGAGPKEEKKRPGRGGRGG